MKKLRIYKSYVGDNNHRAQIHLNGHKNIEQMICDVNSENSHLSKELIFEVLNLFDNKVIDAIRQGFIVDTGLVIMYPILQTASANHSQKSEHYSVNTHLLESYKLRSALSSIDLHLDNHLIPSVKKMEVAVNHSFVVESQNPDGLSNVSDKSTENIFKDWLFS